LFRHRQNSELQEAIDALREAEGDDRDEARDRVREELIAHYDKSMEQYEKHLDELTKRVAELREQISKRRAARDELVDLKLRMIESEVEGLGWPGERSGFRFEFPGLLPGQAPMVDLMDLDVEVPEPFEGPDAVEMPGVPSPAEGVPSPPRGRRGPRTPRAPDDAGRER
jgi:hypothetical protein